MDTNPEALMDTNSETQMDTNTPKQPAKRKAHGADAISRWWCVNCGQKEEMNFEGMKAHLVQKHAIDLNGLKCTRKSILHVDGSEFFANTYEVTIALINGGQVKLTNTVTSPRDKNDLLSRI